ncbi:MAG: hypothetical protein LBJ65_07535, partial [Burkholderia sp.]|nr:hypothetical protein [Burkholderia sp.]
CAARARRHRDVRGRYHTEVFETVARHEIAWFHAPEPADALLLDEHRKMAFSIVSLAFKDDNTWRLYDGTSTIQRRSRMPASCRA